MISSKILVGFCGSILICFIVVTAEGKAANNKLMRHKFGTDSDANQFSPVLFPKINPGEYAIFIDGSYEVFKTKKFENLELDLKCFKNGMPSCEAYSFSQMKPTSSDLEKNKINNFAAAHCHAIYGINLIALDHKKNEFNFCRFKDGSMVNSWSVFMKKSELIKNK